MTRVIIADDHRIVAEGIASLLDGNICCCAMTTTIAETIKAMVEQRPDVLLLDVAMPDGDGIDAIERLLAASPATRIVMLTMYAERAVIDRAIRGGAHGYVVKSAGREQLLAAISSVAGGGTYLCHEAKAVVEAQTAAPQALTAREREVLRLLVAGKSIKEIAGELYLGFETIHTYTKYLRLKLGCKNTASLVRKAMEQHLV